jgi:hypothetical protein
MITPKKKTAATTPSEAANGATNGDWHRIQQELARGLAKDGADKLAEKIAKAAEAVRADLLFMLPTPSGEGMSAVLRIAGANDRFIQILTTESDVTILEGDDIDPSFLRLARASVDVLERIGADRENGIAFFDSSKNDAHLNGVSADLS